MSENNVVSAFEAITSSAGKISYDTCLSSIFEIEEVLLHIHSLNTKVDHLKGLKKYRVEAADANIKHIEEQICQYRSLIQNSMESLKPNEKTLLFPSVGKVVKRKDPDGWEITDEDLFLSYLSGTTHYNDVVKAVPKISMKEAKKLISQLNKQGESVPGVTKIEGGYSISIAFKESDQASKWLPIATEAKKTDQTLDELDNLEV